MIARCIISGLISMIFAFVITILGLATVGIPLELVCSGEIIKIIFGIIAFIVLKSLTKFIWNLYFYFI